LVDHQPTRVTARISRLRPCLSRTATVKRNRPNRTPVAMPVKMFDAIVTSTLNPAPTNRTAVPIDPNPKSPAVLGFVQFP